MYFTNVAAFATALLSPIVAGAPQAPQPPQGGWVPTASIQLANEQSGANANAVIPIDGTYRPVQELWGNTPIARDGLVFASSAQLTTFEQHITCTFSEEPRLSLTLSADRTYSGFGVPVADLCTAYVSCDWAHW